MKLRRFNDAGIEAFREWLDHCRSHPKDELPGELLEDRSLTTVVHPEIAIALQHFETKGEAANYLATILAPLSPDEVTQDAGLWTWLTVHFFDSICANIDGNWVIRNDYMYVFEPSNSRNYYRHLLFLSWHVLRVARGHDRLFLRSQLSTYNTITVDVIKRLYLTRIPCVFEVLDRLYWDEKQGRPRPGITGSKVRAGDLTHRFPLRIRQLERTYDLMSLSADQLIELLGEEFAFARPRKKSRLPFEEMAASIER